MDPLLLLPPLGSGTRACFTCFWLVSYCNTLTSGGTTRMASPIRRWFVRLGCE
eukprot:COSAG05_NODE_66_length_22253_cov_14.954455_5_plen_53_part_00